MSWAGINEPCPRCGSRSCASPDDKACSDNCIMRLQDQLATARDEALENEKIQEVALSVMRDDTLEEAAEICDSRSHNHFCLDNDAYGSEAQDCAGAIRAAKTKEKT